MPEISEISTDKKADHLIMLVGGNPLPNAVAGPLLVKPEGRITLIYSEATYETAGRVATFLKKRGVKTVDKDEDDCCVLDASSSSIGSKIRTALSGSSGTIGLH